VTIVYRQHQRKGIDISHERPRYAFGWKPGLGKTILACGICAERPMPTVVLAPKSIIDCAWMTDIAKFPSIRAIKVHGMSSVGRSRQIQAADWDVAVTTYETWRRHKLDYLNAGVCRMIVDESSKARNPQSKLSKELIPFADKMNEVYILSGTMAPNNFTEYQPQIRLVNKREQDYWKFSYAYGFPMKRHLSIGGRRREVITGWCQTMQQEAALKEHLTDWAWFLRKEDCLDLPEMEDIEIPVELSSEEAGVYKGVREDMVLVVDGEHRAVKGQAVLMKLRQVTSGMVKDGERFGKSKLEALSDLLDEIGPDEPVVIWAEFTHEIDAIRELCMERNEVVSYIDGRSSEKAGQIAASFQSGHLPRLVCHPAAAGHGITLTRAAYCVYFSMSFSAEQYEQSRNRIHRIGQGRPCTYYHLLATLPGKSGDEARTVDHSCYDVSRKKMEMSAAIEVEVERARKEQE
jgi:SNF2 family DNA or RNA helicase